ncbi:hypothetical protein A3C23_04765 [Candidatus Roizmanbacteria bacterium RIFCSPHIGHO2_02_FULL_37_13b]|uniref:Uncharacterized protein n=1 Tax=Candidatus Roizmanbacteria bacterium RIFCSPLOWO2_02_FULL_36_11 TaxID=1802071 RepID=A0A1F7JHR3_9BACT|nr:MAG: hypothetical protein A3C23_04765 [Candidatus Roizmanbacteria bacterium RIFCSPHIGHO2_02_FULL_37_13b]OGK55161.1 MAG: hypothetical protein A3H78_05870 [Candidatus Roizmanbacteria bacterium RIFCSPLOWO2_02_FULL_36_11]
MQNQLVEAKRDLIIHKITGILLDALQNDDLEPEDGAIIAGYLLERKKQITDEKSLNQFMNEVAEKLDIFRGFINLQKEKDSQNSLDNQKLEDIKSQLVELARTQSN